MDKTLLFAKSLSLFHLKQSNQQLVVRAQPSHPSPARLPRKRARFISSSSTPAPVISTENVIASTLAVGDFKKIPSVIAQNIDTLSYSSLQRVVSALNDTSHWSELIHVFSLAYKHPALRPRFTARLITEVFYASMKTSNRTIGKQAYNIFEQLRESDDFENLMGPKAFNFLFSCLCKALLIDESKIVGQCCTELGYYLNRYSYNSFLHACAKTNRVADAFHSLRAMAESNILPDVVSCNVLISCCVRSDEIDVALSVLRRMSDWGIQPDIYSFNSVVNGFRKRGMLEKAFDIVASMEISAGEEPLEGRQPPGAVILENSVRPDLVTYNTLLSGIAEAENPDLERARAVQEHMSKRGINCTEVTYNALMAIAARSNRIDEAFAIYHEMMQPEKKITPNCECYTTLISLCGQAGQMERAFKVHDQMVSSGISPNIVTFNALLVACRRVNGKNSADIALEVLNLMRETPGCTPDVITYSTLIDTLGRDCRFVEMRSLLEEMVNHGLRPNLITFTSMIAALVRTGEIDDALDIIFDMDAEGVEPNVHTFTCIMNGASRRREFQRCFEIFGMMLQRGIQPINVSYGILLQASVRSGQHKWMDCFFEEVCKDKRFSKTQRNKLDDILHKEGVFDLQNNSDILNKALDVIDEALGENRTP